MQSNNKDQNVARMHEMKMAEKRAMEKARVDDEASAESGQISEHKWQQREAA